MTDFLKDLLVIIALTMLSVLTPVVVGKIKEYTELLKEKSENDLVDSYIAKASSIIESVVVMVNQTFVDECKKNGNFDADNAYFAYKLALDKAKTLITTEMAGVISDVYGDFGDWLDIKIEEAVNKSKTTYLSPIGISDDLEPDINEKFSDDVPEEISKEPSIDEKNSMCIKPIVATEKETSSVINEVSEPEISNYKLIGIDVSSEDNKSSEEQCNVD